MLIELAVGVMIKLACDVVTRTLRINCPHTIKSKKIGRTKLYIMYLVLISSCCVALLCPAY